MITKETMLKIAERNMHKAKMSLLNNYNRKGITEGEIKNLLSNVEYTQAVYDLIEKNVE